MNRPQHVAKQNGFLTGHIRAYAATFALLFAVLFGADVANAADEMATPSSINTQALLSETSDFKAQPLALLAKFPEAGAALAAFVAKLASDQPTVIDAILSIVEISTPEQASALGAGLIRAARALNARHPDLVKSLTEKIERSENIWLKTTFSALGIRHGMALTFVAPPTLPPRTYKDLGGTTLPSFKGRLSAPESRYTVAKALPRTSAKSAETFGIDRTGTIVAIIYSDADQSGAQSTSPTN